MSTATRHAKAGPLGRFAALFRYREDRPARPVISTGLPGFDIPTCFLPAAREQHEAPHGIGTPGTLAAIITQAEAEARTASIPPAEPWGPWDQPNGNTPHSEPETPLGEEYQRWYGWGVTLPDNRAPMPRRYAPEPHTPDLCQDLADLEIFRETLGTRTRRHPAGCACGHPVECLCGHPVTGDTWAERLVRVGIHLLTSEGAAA